MIDILFDLMDGMCGLLSDDNHKIKQKVNENVGSVDKTLCFHLSYRLYVVFILFHMTAFSMFHTKLKK